jgi:exopolysaccharide production protein ExoZ
VFAFRMITGLHYLRAIAAMLVVGHHATTFFPDRNGWSNFGASGVDIFFVISGFVMALTTQGSPRALSAPHAAYTFLLRRLIRVVPLYWLSLLWSCKGDALLGHVDLAVLMDFLFIPRFNPVYNNHLYPVLVPGWTINYEMFFYAIFTVSILFRQYKYPVIFATLLAIITCGHLTEFSSAIGQFYTKPIMLEFLYGILVYQAIQTLDQRHFRPVAWPALMAGFVFLAFSDPEAPSRAYVVGPCAALIVYAAITALKDQKIPLLHMLADASFSIYLTHQFTFRLSRMLLRNLDPIQPTAFTIALALVVQMVIAAALGVLFHRWVEKPITRWLTRHLIKSKDRAPANKALA